MANDPRNDLVVAQIVGSSLPADLYLSLLLAALNGREKMQVGDSLLEFAGRQKESNPRELKLFLPDLPSFDLRCLNFITVIVNLGALTIAREKALSFEQMVRIVKARLKPAIAGFLQRGRQVWEEEKARAKALIDANVFALDDKRIRFFSLFSREDEIQLKKFYVNPAFSQTQLDQRQIFYEKLENLLLLSQGLAVKSLITGFTDGKGGRYDFAQFNQLRRDCVRLNDNFASNGNGVMLPLLSSLLMRLFLLTLINREHIERYFEQIGSQQFPRYKLSIEKVRQRSLEMAKSLARLNTSFETMSSEHFYQQTVQMYNDEFMKGYASLLVVNREQCDEFLRRSKFPGMIESMVNEMALLFTAILENETLAALGLNKKTLQEQDMNKLGMLIQGVLQQLQTDAQTYQNSGDYSWEQMEQFWHSRLVFGNPSSVDLIIHAGDGLMAGQRLLSIGKICRLPKLQDVLLHLSNVLSWEAGDRQALVEKFNWQRFLKEAESNGRILIKLFECCFEKNKKPEDSLWPQIFAKFNLSSDTVCLQIIFELFDYAFSRNLLDLQNWLLTCATQMHVAERDLCQLVFPSDLSVMSINEQKARYALFLAWLSKAERESLDWMSADWRVVGRWLDFADNNNIFWLVALRLPIEKLARYLKNKAPSARFCPKESEDLPVIGPLIYRMNKEDGITNKYIVEIDGVRMTHKLAHWYQQIKLVSEKHAKYICDYFKKQL